MGPRSHQYFGLFVADYNRCGFPQLITPELSFHRERAYSHDQVRDLSLRQQIGEEKYYLAIQGSF